MQKASTKKTELALKTKLRILLASTVMTAILVGGTFGLVAWMANPVARDCSIWLEGKCIQFEGVNTPEGLSRGLSGRESLDDHDGMLFSFQKEQTVCMWMKDMRFAIDMVWLDGRSVVTKIENNVSPDTYPNTFCQDNAHYVLELNAGVAKRAKLQVGKQIHL